MLRLIVGQPVRTPSVNAPASREAVAARTDLCAGASAVLGAATAGPVNAVGPELGLIAGPAI
eukprot:6466571-Alexandrium_andersonii.AAC.1